LSSSRFIGPISIKPRLKVAIAEYARRERRFGGPRSETGRDRRHASIGTACKEGNTLCYGVSRACDGAACHCDSLFRRMVLDRPLTLAAIVLYVGMARRYRCRKPSARRVWGHSSCLCAGWVEAALFGVAVFRCVALGRRLSPHLFPRSGAAGPCLDRLRSSRLDRFLHGAA